jgi:hypothetical protein
MPIEAALRESLGGILERVFFRFGFNRADRSMPAAPAHFGWPRWLGHAGQLDYINQVLNIALDRSFIELIKGCGPFWVFDSICFAAERPIHINHDEAGRLHCEVGPSFAFRSGWCRWHWHGVEVDRQIIEEPRRITIEDIEAARRHPEFQRILIERYRHGNKVHGIAAYLRDAGGVRLDHDEVFGTLWRRSVRGEAPVLMIEVVNHTPEPDGSYKHHFLRVDTNLRPILADGTFGPPQPLTARNAVASTFGLTGGEYMPEVET